MSRAGHTALLIVSSAIAFAYSTALLLAPNAVLNLFALPDGATAVWLGRLVGAMMLGAGTLAFFCRHVEDVDARRAIDASYLVGSSAAVIIMMWAMYLQVMNALGWINVAVAGGLSIAYFYFLAAENGIAPSGARPA